MVMFNQLVLVVLFVVGVGICAQLHYRQNSLWLVFAMVVATGSVFMQLVDVDTEPTVEQVLFHVAVLMLAMSKIDHAMMRFTLNRRRQLRPVRVDHRKEEMQND